MRKRLAVGAGALALAILGAAPAAQAYDSSTFCAATTCYTLPGGNPVIDQYATVESLVCNGLTSKNVSGDPMNPPAARLCWRYEYPDTHGKVETVVIPNVVNVTTEVGGLGHGSSSLRVALLQP